MKKETLKRIVDHMYPIREEYFPNKNHSEKDFDYPDYGGLPESIIKSLSSEAVDAMQFILNWPYKAKRLFARDYKERLIGLGEKVE
jgi:hypothetical protein